MLKAIKVFIAKLTHKAEGLEVVVVSVVTIIMLAVAAFVAAQHQRTLRTSGLILIA